MPIWLNNMVYTRTAVSRFMATPASKTGMRFQGLAAAIPPGTFGSSSPLILLNPPNGIQFRVKSVPFQVNSLIARGGNPIPNSSTSMPIRRATIKCPSSWIRIIPAKTTTKMIPPSRLMFIWTSLTKKLVHWKLR